MKKIPLLLTLCFLFSTNLFTAQDSTCFICHKSNFDEPDKAQNNDLLLKPRSKVIPKGCTQGHCFHLDCFTAKTIRKEEMICPVEGCTCKVTLPMRKYSRKKTKNGPATLEWFKDYGMVLEWTDPETHEVFRIGHTEDNPLHVCPLKHSEVKTDHDTVPLLTLSYARRMILAAQHNARDTLAVGLKAYTGYSVPGKQHAVLVFNSLAENAHPENKQMLCALNIFTTHLKKEIESEDRVPQKISDEKIKEVHRLSSMGRYGIDNQGRHACSKGKINRLTENNNEVYFIYH